MSGPRKTTTIIGRDGGRTIVSDHTNEEMRGLLDQAGLSELNKHAPDLSRLDPLAMISGFQQLQGLMGIRRLAPRNDEGIDDFPTPAPAPEEDDTGLGM